MVSARLDNLYLFVEATEEIIRDINATWNQICKYVDLTTLKKEMPELYVSYLRKTNIRGF